jgi:hypothetical protein
MRAAGIYMSEEQCIIIILYRIASSPGHSNFSISVTLKQYEVRLYTLFYFTQEIKLIGG